MKKFCIFILCVTVLSVCVSACTAKPDASMVKSQRRFAKYIEPQKQNQGVIDLSEGPKLRYDANFGPKAPEFDIKIRNPY